MMQENGGHIERAHCGDDALGRTVDQIVALVVELEVSGVRERAVLRRKLAAAGYRLNRLATRQRAA